MGRFQIVRVIPFALLVFCGCAGHPRAGDSPSSEIEPAMRRVYPALVRIMVVTAEPSEGRLRKFEAAGSGAIISPDGYVVTNHHVAGKARHIACDLPDGERIEARLVGTDVLADIAVIKLDLASRKAGARPLAAAAFGDSDRLRVGDVVLAMGSPVALSQSVTRGIVSNTRMVLPQLLWPLTFKLDGEDVGSLVRWIGHDAPIIGGNSGGPLVNLDGEIVGINEIGIGIMGGAIPSNLARDVVDQIIRKGRVDRSWTGLEVQPRLKDGLADRGVLVSGVIHGSPADRAGIKAGDVLTSFDGQAVDCAIPDELPVFNRLVLSTPVGKTVAVEARRGDQSLKVSLTTALRESSRGLDEELRAWGMTARDFTLMSALEARRKDRSGVHVNTLRPGGPCAEAKPPVKEGDVIVEVAGKPVRNIEELRTLTRELTRDATQRSAAMVGIERDGQKLLTVVRVGAEKDADNPAQARKAWLSVATQVLTRDLAAALKLAGRSGVRITQVFEGKAADKAGLKVGDVILKLDGDTIAASEIEDAEVFANMLRQRRIGDEVALDIVRDGKPLSLKVRLEEPPTPASALATYKNVDLEFSARELSFDDRTARKLAGDLRGVLIDRVEMAGWAALAHMAAGDIVLSVDGRPTPDVASLAAAMENARKAKARRVVFFVKRHIHTLFVEIQPNWDILDKE